MAAPARTSDWLQSVGVTYNLADPDMSLMDIGTAEGTAGFEMGRRVIRRTT